MGCLLYFLVSGEYPAKLGGLTTKEATEALGKRRPLMDLRPDLPDLFLRTVSKAMEDDPAKRFSSSGQLASALSECLGMSSTAEAIPAAPVVAEKRQRTLVTRIIIAATVLLGVFGFKDQTVRQWLHLEKAPVAAGISANATTSTSRRRSC